MKGELNKNGKTRPKTAIEIEVNINTANLDKAIKKAKLLNKLIQQAQEQEGEGHEKKKCNNPAH